MQIDLAPPGEGEAREVAEGVLWLRLPLPMRLDHVNCYAFDEGDGWTLVDTGFATRRARAIWARLLGGQLGGQLGGRPVRRLLVTHHHPDHVGLAGWFQERGAELMMPRTAWLFARMLRLDDQAVPPPEMLAFWGRAGMDAAIRAERAGQRPFNYADMVAAMPLGFTRISDGQELMLGGRRWRVRFGHGHAPDHATLWGEDHDLVLTGDQILPRISPNLGVYATEPEADPVGEFLASCIRLGEFAHERHIGLPGHERPFTGLPGRLRALMAEHAERLDRLVAWLAEPRQASACFEPLYGRRISKSEYGLALSETIGHLNHLLRTGRVERELHDGAWLWRRR